MSDEPLKCHFGYWENISQKNNMGLCTQNCKIQPKQKAKKINGSIFPIFILTRPNFYTPVNVQKNEQLLFLRGKVWSQTKPLAAIFLNWTFQFWIAVAWQPKSFLTLEVYQNDPQTVTWIVRQYNWILPINICDNYASLKSYLR